MAITKTAFTLWAIQHGYALDKYGHLQKTIAHNDSNGLPTTTTYRYKLSAIAARKEIKVNHEHGGNSWTRLFSGYFSKMSINDKDQLEGMKR